MTDQIIMNNAGNAVFDPERHECVCLVHQIGGQLCAFVQVMDIGNPGNRHAVPYIKRYCGEYSWDDEAGSIRDIMNNGTKWPTLPDDEASYRGRGGPYELPEGLA